MEPKSRSGNPESYVVFGQRYHVMNSVHHDYAERGIASWYGKKFHGRRTSSGETYDMYAMTAAHRSLPLPTYVRVTNLKNSSTVIVKVNDRGPFHDNRIIDLSYTAAVKLGIVRTGTGLVEVRVIDPSRSDAQRVQYAAASSPQPAERPALASVDATPPTSITELEFETMRPQAQPGPELPPESIPDVQTVYERPSVEPKLFLQLGAYALRPNADRVAAQAGPVAGDRVGVFRGLKDDLAIYRVRVGPLVNVAEADTMARELESLGLAPSQVIVETP